MEQLPQTNPKTTSKDTIATFSFKDLEANSDFLDNDVFLDHEDDSSEETRSQSEIFKKPQDISKKKYHYIPDDLRLKLIDEVENKGEKIKHAAKKLNINYSSAKSICQIYRKEGRSNKKISKRKGLKEEFTKLIQEMRQTGDMMTGNTPPAQVNQPNIHMTTEENTQTDESSDTLTALRDRLLQSRAKSRLENNMNYSEIPLDTTEASQFSGNGKDFSDVMSNQTGDSQVYQDQKSVGFVQSNPGPAKYMTAYMPMPAAQTVYYLIPYQNMSGNTFPQLGMGATNPQNMQSFSIGGPSQTININQPQANTISTQSISILNTSSSSQNQNEGSQNFYSSYGFNNPMQQQQQQQQQQPQYQQIPGQNGTSFVSYQPPGIQMMRPVMYMMPQGNGGMQNNNGMYQVQVPQNNMNYNMMYNPNQKLMSGNGVQMQFSNGLEPQIQNENGNFKQDLIEIQSDNSQYSMTKQN